LLMYAPPAVTDRPLCAQPSCDGARTPPQSNEQRRPGRRAPSLKQIQGPSIVRFLIADGEVRIRLVHGFRSLRASSHYWAGTLIGCGDCGHVNRRRSTREHPQ
jgi:hypothetical protein